MARKDDKCPVCNGQFQKKDMLLKFWVWEGTERSKLSKLAHAACALVGPKFAKALKDPEAKVVKPAKSAKSAKHA
jgi:tRNA U54 and U55 pseudouridine synthase Pus10